MITLRPINDDDCLTLRQIYASTRQEELCQVPWTNAEKESFLAQQFTLQHNFYRQHFTDAEFDLILWEDEPIGRLYVDRREDEIRVVDIALLPEFRGKGIGTAIMSDLLHEAASAAKPVRIHVAPSNPAMRLYDRLGFHKTGDTGVYHLMEWSGVGVPCSEEQP